MYSLDDANFVLMDATAWCINYWCDGPHHKCRMVSLSHSCNMHLLWSPDTYTNTNTDMDMRCWYANLHDLTRMWIWTWLSYPWHEISYFIFHIKFLVTVFLFIFWTLLKQWNCSCLQSLLTIMFKSKKSWNFMKQWT